MTEALFLFVGLLLAAYLAGSVNFSIILFRVTGRSDPRGQFSGNPGTTNVYRQAGLFWAIVVLLLDFSRAMAVAWLAMVLLPLPLVPWVGLGLILGNRFPCFHSFKGGKGVANFLGFFALPGGILSLLSTLVWVIAYGLIRKPFIASFLMIFTLGGLVIYRNGTDPAAVAGITVTCLFIVYNHKPNLAELFQKRRAAE
ncbi:glycerol-3-phosphate acyltransferase [bacterium]|nr:glycerol-3-phosphate acyltransferase [bacterium]